jgi:hypothetical protein
LLEGASKSTLENEFGTSNEDEAVLKILEKGTLQEFEVCCFLGGGGVAFHQSSHLSFLLSSAAVFGLCRETGLHPLLRRHGLCSVDGGEMVGRRGNGARSV